MKKIVIASNNNHKIEEVKEILDEYEILSLKDIGFFDEIEENGTTFEENAIIKAKTVYEYLKNKNMDYMIIADDSGLCVDSLNGNPGVYSARYSGEHGNDQANRDKLQNELIGKDRTARFMCAIALFLPNGESKTFFGETEGKITEQELGNKDFGYDCIFYANDIGKTFGEASKEEKNSISHRGRALEKLKEWLNNTK